MEVVIFIGALILVIVGSAIIMTFFDFLEWLFKKVTGIRIGNDEQDH